MADNTYRAADEWKASQAIITGSAIIAHDAEIR
jgi:hypothetical protein